MVKLSVEENTYYHTRKNIEKINKSSISIKDMIERTSSLTKEDKFDWNEHNPATSPRTHAMMHSEFERIEPESPRLVNATQLNEPKMASMRIKLEFVIVEPISIPMDEYTEIFGNTCGICDAKFKYDEASDEMKADSCRKCTGY